MDNRSLPSYKYIPHKNIGRRIGVIQLVYNCTVNDIGESKIKLILTPHSCPPFTLNWIKECRIYSSESEPLPFVDISLNGNEVLSNGTRMIPNVFNRSSDAPFIVSEMRLSLMIASHNKEKYKIRPIEMKYSSLPGFDYKMRGMLSNGGPITSTAETVVINFSCVFSGMVDVEVSIPFENNEIIRMYFKKECGVMESNMENQRFKFFIWIVIAIAISFFVLVSLFYFIQNPFFFFEAFIRLITAFEEIKYRALKYNKLPSMGNNEERMSSDVKKPNDEDDLFITYRIKVCKMNKEKKKKIRVELSYV